MADNNASNALQVAVLQNLVLAINNMNQTLLTLFPNASNTISASSGSSSGDFLAITINGVNYKLDLLDP